MQTGERRKRQYAQLEAKLPHGMVVQVLRQFSPLKIHLSDPEENRRWIELDPPSSVEFLADEGVKVTTTGRFRFDVAKVTIPAQLNRIEFLLLPKVIPVDDGLRLAIPIEILDADVRMIPNLIDNLIVAQVNAALTPRASQLVWRMSETLSAAFKMPERLEPLEELRLVVEESSFEVAEDYIALRIGYEISLTRSD